MSKTSEIVKLTVTASDLRRILVALEFQANRSPDHESAREEAIRLRMLAAQLNTYLRDAIS